jgi:hypothetical protein
MKIRTPRVRAYYPASQNEPEWLFCWIPPQGLEELATAGHIRSSILEEHPSGLEVEVTQRSFDEFELDLGVDPAALHHAYESLHKLEVLPQSGIVAADQLEGLVKSASPGAGDLEADALMVGSDQPLAEPEWTDGDDPRSAMLQL